jgi:glycosyltransferase involved in cell wall biosynthesis
MSEKPRISVIIPVFNLAKYIGEAVDSVLNQTCRDFEIILVDDGSTDRSREIIEGYCIQIPERVKALFMDHGGASAARNAGINESRGEWIAFLDGDDVWQPTKLAEQLKLANADPRCNFVACAAQIYGRKRLFQAIPAQPFDFKVELLRQGCFITLSTVLIQRELLASIRFNEKLEGAQDFDFFLSLADSARLGIIRLPLVFYRRREEAISGLRSGRFMQVHRHFQVFQREFRRLQQEDPSRIEASLAELQGVLDRIAHDAAYSAIMNLRASVALRLKLTTIAIKRCPWRLKNYRILVQALLPAALNQWLTQFWHGKASVPKVDDDRQLDQHS